MGSYRTYALDSWLLRERERPREPFAALRSVVHQRDVREDAHAPCGHSRGVRGTLTPPPGRRGEGILSLGMETALIILVILQTLILIGVLAAMSALLARVRALGDQTESLLRRVDQTLDAEVVPTLREARETLQRIHEAAGGASKALSAVEPIADTVGRYTSALRPSKNTLWLDGLRFGLGILQLLRARTKGQRAGEPTTEDDQPEKEVQTNGE